MARILVPLIGDKKDGVALTAAHMLASGQGGLIEARLFQRDPLTAMPIVGEGVSAVNVEKLLDAARHLREEQVSSAGATFEAWCTKDAVPHGDMPLEGQVAANFTDIEGGIPASIITPARVADVTIVVTEGSNEDASRHELTQAVLLDALRPVMLVPTQLPSSIGKRVIVAWNGSAEAARAVSMSYGILKAADAVTVVSVGKNADPELLAKTLQLNSIKASAVSVGDKSSNATDVLNAEAKKQSADLMIIGAYSHNRLREFVFGGVTQDLYKNPAIPTLMIH